MPDTVTISASGKKVATGFPEDDSFSFEAHAARKAEKENGFGYPESIRPIREVTNTVTMTVDRMDTG